MTEGSIGAGAEEKEWNNQTPSHLHPGPPTPPPPPHILAINCSENMSDWIFSGISSGSGLLLDHSVSTSIKKIGPPVGPVRDVFTPE